MPDPADITINRHPDRVRMSNIAQSTNVLLVMILPNGDQLMLIPTSQLNGTELSGGRLSIDMPPKSITVPESE